jgi:hypothetical protein
MPLAFDFLGIKMQKTPNMNGMPGFYEKYT